VNRNFAAICLALGLAGCSRKPQAIEAQRHYGLTGRVIALNAKDRTITVDAAAIPNYMEAMTMEYPVRSKADFDHLHVGDKITATVNVGSDGLYDLSNVERQSSAASK
jgi:Cu/Ag efflux protein CusF